MLLAVESENDIISSLGYYAIDRSLVENTLHSGLNGETSGTSLILRRTPVYGEKNVLLEVNMVRAFRDGVKIYTDMENGVFLLGEIRPEHISGVVEKV